MSYKGKKVCVIVVAAGSGKRMNKGINKLFIEIDGQTILGKTLEIFQKNEYVDEIVLVLKNEEKKYCIENILDRQSFTKVRQIVSGGRERANSVYEGLKNVRKDCEIVLIHDGARPYVSQEIVSSVIMETEVHKMCVVGVPVIDTIKIVDNNDEILDTPTRKTLWKAQTPQCFEYNLIVDAYNKALTDEIEFTDDSSLMEKLGYKVRMVMGSYDNIKITVPQDLKRINDSENERIRKQELTMKVGMGYDVHKLVEGRKLILGGVQIHHDKGLLGHSDADVLIHALMDAILGALGLGDIGRHFPDTDDAFKGISSMKLLEHVCKLMTKKGYNIGNVDCTIVAQKPKLAQYIDDMIINIAKVLKTDKDNVNIKATTTEKLGFEGRQEGISSQAIVLLNKAI